MAFYGSLSQAAADLNSGTEENRTLDNDAASVIVVPGDNGIPRAVLLKDCAEAAQIDISTDMVLVLNGKTLSLTAEGAFLNVGAGVRCEINGEAEGSTIVKENTASALESNTLITTAGNLAIHGGTYNFSGTFKQYAMVIKATGTAEKLVVNDAVLQINDTTASGGTVSRAIQTQAAETEITRCEIECNTNSKTDGLTIAGKRTVIRDCSVKANTNSKVNTHNSNGLNIFANSVVKAERCLFFGDSIGDNSDITFSHGVYNAGVLHLIDCDTHGTLAGCSNYGEIYIEGGVHTGYSHGGVYFTHGESGKGYANDASFRCGIYEGIHGTGGFVEALGDLYIGGGTQAKASGMTVFMDGCTVGRGNGGIIALRGTSGEKNNTLNISNTTIEAPAILRIDDGGHKVNVGMGTNITEDVISNPEYAEFTDGFYRRLPDEGACSGKSFNTVAELAGRRNGSSENLNPVAKTEGMTQPVGVDENGQLWTAPGGAGGESEENADTLLGTLPMTISESNCYLLSETNATISTGDGAAQLIDMDANVPYIGDTTYNGGAFEIIGKNTVKISFANVSKNATAYVPTKMEAGKTYTLIAKLVEKSDDLVSTKMPIVRVFDATTGGQYQVVTTANGVMQYKTFTAPKDNTDVQVVLPAVSGTYVAGETYATVSVYLYEGEHVEIPTGATFDILAGEKYSTDGYIGATLSEVNGKTVQVYKTDTSGSESETDNGGVIFFGDSILHYSDVTSRYAAKTGKSVLNCAVGGTRMSASRDSANSYYPLDMANIADAIASGDFSAQLNSSVVTSAFTTLASATISNYKAIVLEFGTNDFSAKVSFDGNDATSIKGALKHILTSILTKYPNMRIGVLSTLQYVAQGTGTVSGVPTHDNGTVWQMNEVIKGVCESDEFCVPFVDMYHAFGQNGITRNTLNSDGVHLTSPNGAKRYADILTAKLNGLGI
jgi:hypothetical protein